MGMQLKKCPNGFYMAYGFISELLLKSRANEWHYPLSALFFSSMPMNFSIAAQIASKPARTAIKNTLSFGSIVLSCCSIFD